MSGVRFYPSGGTSLAPGVVLSSFTANTIPYINGSQEVAEDVNFTYQSGQLGVGISSSLGARVHIKGANDSTGASLIVQSATYEVLKAYNSRNLNIGGGSVSAGTDYKITAFGTATADTHVNTQFIGYANDNVFTIYNTNGYTNGGIRIRRDQFSSGRVAFSVSGGTAPEKVGLYIYSDGGMQWPNSNTWRNENSAHIQYVNTAGKPGLQFNITSSNEGFIFHKGRSTALLGDKPFMRLYTDFTDSGLPNSATQTILLINPTGTFTNAGSVSSVIGLDLDIQISSVNTTGINYGVLSRYGLNGFGLGATLPVGYIHVGAGTTAIPQMKLETSAAPTGGALTNGCFWYDGTDLKFRTGGVTKTVTLV